MKSQTKRKNHFSPSGKKGNAALETVTIVIVLVIFGIAAVVGMSAFTELNDEIQNDADISNSTKDMSGSLHTTYPSLMDGAFMFLFIGLVLFVIASAFFIDSHPVFFVFAIVLLLSANVVAMLLGDAFDDIMGDDSLSSYANQLPYTSWVMRNLLTVSLVVGFTAVISMFIKMRNG